MIFFNIQIVCWLKCLQVVTSKDRIQMLEEAQKKKQEMQDESQKRKDELQKALVTRTVKDGRLGKVSNFSSN